MSTPKYCGHCGSAIQQPGAFCAECGRPLLRPDEPGASTVPAPPPLNGAADPTTMVAGTIRIGRDPASDVPVDDPLASLRHAEVCLGEPPSLRDLGSFRGTYVNGRRLSGPATIDRGDEVLIASHSLIWNGHALVAAPPRGERSFRATGLTVSRGDKRLLEDVSFDLAPGTLTAVIGPSGAGKSTLLGALSGLRPATAGEVRWRGLNLYAHYEHLRYQIGLVPQQDIQHSKLKVGDALSFAAELRLPPDTEPTRRQERVAAVAADLQLTRQIDNRIGAQLSGGQRKRVSIATELLTAPPLLFLDEPTSGLDPGLDLELMRQLRQLADEGRTVLVVTHSVLALHTCDQVLVLAPGGRLAFLGPPDQVLSHFGCHSYPEVFDTLDRAAAAGNLAAIAVVPPKTAAAMLTEDMQEPPPAPVTLPETTKPVRPSRDVLRAHFGTLVRRNIAVVAGDKLLLTMLLSMPIVLGILSRVVPGSAGMSLINAPLGPGGYLNASEAGKRITLLIVSAVLMGAAMTIRELVGERPIYQREYAVGLFPDVYLASKVAVFGATAFAQGCVVVLIATAGLPGPDFHGVVGMRTFELVLAIGLLTLATAICGLATSAILTSTEQAMPALVGIVMAQLVLSGAIVEVFGRPGLQQLAMLTPARWAYAACASTVALQRPQREQGADLDSIAIHTGAHWLVAMLMLVLLSAAVLALARLAVRRSARQRRW